MAQVTTRVVGGAVKNINATTVGDAKRQLGLTNHMASVNGVSVQDTHTLRDNDTIVFATQSKGG